MIEDRRGPGPLLDRRGQFLLKRQVVVDREISRPAWRRNFDYARIIERGRVGIELGIGPFRGQDGSADVVPVGRGLEVDRVADRRELYLTPRGWKALIGMKAKIEQHEKHFRRRFSDSEQTTLISFLRRFYDA